MRIFTELQTIDGQEVEHTNCDNPTGCGECDACTADAEDEYSARKDEGELPSRW